MQVTLKGVIRALPLEQALKSQLLEQFDSLDEEKKLTISRVLWATYDAMYDMKLEENTQKALQLAKGKKEPLDKEFYARVKKQTDKDMETDLVSVATQVDLAETRTELQELISGS